MEQFVQLISQDGYNLFIPVSVAIQAEYINKIVMKAEEDVSPIKIELNDIKGDTLEIVYDYLIYKYYYEHMKDINLVLNKDYDLDEKKALDVLIASTKLGC